MPRSCSTPAYQRTTSAARPDAVDPLPASEHIYIGDRHTAQQPLDTRWTTSLFVQRSAAYSDSRTNGSSSESENPRPHNSMEGDGIQGTSPSGPELAKTRGGMAMRTVSSTRQSLFKFGCSRMSTSEMGHVRKSKATMMAMECQWSTRGVEGLPHLRAYDHVGPDSILHASSLLPSRRNLPSPWCPSPGRGYEFHFLTWGSS